MENGLSTEEAKELLRQYGHNVLPEKKRNSFLILLCKFWEPIAWMLEITIVLQIIIGKINEAAVIFGLLVFNSLLSFFQEARANKAFELLQKQLVVNSRVKRDDKWQLISALELVPNDLIYLRMGDIVPADINLIDGELLLDQSTLTGESLPVAISPKKLVYSGSLVKQGEASGKVIATGKNTFFGKTAELVKIAEPTSHIRNIIFTIIKYLVSISTVLAILVFIFALAIKQPVSDVLAFILILLVSAIPAVLPATFTLAVALGAHSLSKKGVLITHLSAIEEAAIMDTICLDKTGTITLNELHLDDFICYTPYSKNDLLTFALAASDEATKDPIDVAIFKAADLLKLQSPKKIKFFPFDPAKKYTEAISKINEKKIHVIKGSPMTIIDMLPNNQRHQIISDVEQLAARGLRVIAVAINVQEKNLDGKNFQSIGLLAFNDPPRNDSKEMIKNLEDLGLRTQIVTGDNAITAKAIAEQVGLGVAICDQAMFHQNRDKEILNCDIFAGLFPGDKFNLVKSLQQLGHVTGMTGDGVNDAPALKQAEVGIAVLNATDVAKSAASIILTTPGLSGIINAVETSRRIHKRMLTYILNKITKSFEIAIFLCLGVMITKTFIITPLLMVILLFTNDFLTMSITTDNVHSSPKPEKWQTFNLMYGAGILSILMLIPTFSIFFFGRNYLHLTLPKLQTLCLILLAFTGQGNIYLIRERRHFWHSRPSFWIILSSIFGITIISILATQGIFMTAISLNLVIATLILIAIYLFFIDFLKVKIFALWKII